VAEDEVLFEQQQAAEHEAAVQRARDARRAQLLQRTRASTLEDQQVSHPPGAHLLGVRRLFRRTPLRGEMRGASEPCTAPATVYCTRYFPPECGGGCDTATR
jgi:hypothetical protein